MVELKGEDKWRRAIVVVRKERANGGRSDVR